MAKKLKDDDIKLNVSVGTDTAQNDIRKLADANSELAKSNRELERSMASLEKMGARDTDMFREYEAQLAKNKQTIKENDKEISRLTSTLSINSKTMAQLREAAKNLQAQMDRVNPKSENWQSLNKDFRNVRARMKEIQKETFDTTGGITKFAQTINKYWSVIGIGIGAVVKGFDMLKGAMMSTGSTASKWTEMVAGMEAGYNAFMRTIATGDWSNFFSNISTAIKAGQQYAKAMNMLADAEKSYEIRKAETMTKIMQLETEAKNVSISAEERARKNAEINQLYEDLYNEEVNIRKKQYDETVAYNLKLVGLTEDNKGLLEDYMKYALAISEQTNEEWDEQIKKMAANMQKVEEYDKKLNAKRKVTQYGFGGTPYTTEIDDTATIKKAQAETSDEIKQLHALHKKLTTEQKQAIKETATAVETAEQQKIAAMEAATLRTGKILKKSQKEHLSELEANLETHHQTQLTIIQKARLEEQDTDAQFNLKTAQEDARYYAERIQKLEEFLKTTNNKTLRAELERKIATDRNKELEAQRKAEQGQIAVVKEFRDEQLNTLQLSYDKQHATYQKSLADKKITQEQFDLLMLGLDNATAERRFQIQEDYYCDVNALDIQSGELRAQAIEEANKAVIAADLEAAAQRAAIQKTLSETTTDFKKQFAVLSAEQEKEIQLQALKETYEARKKFLEDAHQDTTELTKAYEQAKKNIKLNADQEYFNLRQELGLTSWEQEYDMEMANLQNLLDNKLISEKEYEKAKFNMQVAQAKKYTNYYLGLFSGAMSALQDAETAQIDARYDAQIAAAEGNAEEIERLEQEKAQKKLDVEKKYADVNFAIKVAEIVANTAVAIMQAYSQLGPIAGSVAATLMGVTGAMQVVAANAERQKIKSMTLGSGGGSKPTQQRVVLPGKGFDDGGYPGGGPRLEPAGIVHRGEYVVAQPEMRQPTVMHHVRAIESIRNRRTRKNTLPGYDDGGYVNDPNASNPNIPSAPNITSDPRLIALLEKNADLLQYLKDNGLDAYVLLSELEKQQARLKKSITLGSRR